MILLNTQEHLYVVLACDGQHSDVLHAYCPYHFEIPDDIEKVPLGSTDYSNYVSLTLACTSIVAWKMNETFSIHFHPSSSFANPDESAMFCMAICSDLAH